MAAKTAAELAAQEAEAAAKVAQEAEAARLADALATQAQGAGGVTVDPGLADPAAVTNATAPGVMTPGSTEPAQLIVALAGKRDAPKTVTCGGCNAAWPADRLGPGVTIPCTCGRLIVIE